MKLHTDDINETIDRWFREADPGDWVGVFENHDLGHPDLGIKLGFVYGEDQWDGAKIGRTSGPDTKAFGLGWRYLLIAKCRTPDEAKDAMS